MSWRIIPYTPGMSINELLGIHDDDPPDPVVELKKKMKETNEDRFIVRDSREKKKRLITPNMQRVIDAVKAVGYEDDGFAESGWGNERLRYCIFKSGYRVTVGRLYTCFYSRSEDRTVFNTAKDWDKIQSYLESVKNKMDFLGQSD